MIQEYLMAHGADPQLVPQNRPVSLDDIPMFKLYKIPKLETDYNFLESNDNDYQDDEISFQEEETKRQRLMNDISSFGEEFNFDHDDSEYDSSSDISDSESDDRIQIAQTSIDDIIWERVDPLTDTYFVEEEASEPESEVHDEYVSINI